MTQNLKAISKMICDAHKVPIVILNNKNNLISSYGDQVKHPLFDSIEEFIRRLIQPEDQQNIPLIRTTNYLETFIVFHLSSIETIIIGPFSSYEVTESMVYGIIQDLQISSAYQEELFLYYSQLEWLNQKRILSLCCLTYYLICQEPLEEELVKSQMKNSEKSEPAHIEQLIRNRRLDASFHMDYGVEQKIWQCVKEGDKKGLQQHLDTIKIEGVGLLSKKSQLRNMKNHTIISIALATRAAIDGGLYPEIAYTLSDVSIQKVEETTELQKVHLIGQDHLFSLIDLIIETTENDNSKAVQICKNYIFNHLFEQISIQYLANLVHLNPVYLSQLFKKETGIPLGKYIQTEKLKEAQKLLIQSDQSIAEICMMLHFNDQSYFSSIFKKYTGLTPNQYRKNPIIH